jgi:ABC-type transporter Mla MlaB component
MLRIIQSPSFKVITISLEGKLLQPWIEEVRNAIDAARSEGTVRLDLSKLSFADESGLILLRQLQAGGVELSARSALLAGLMQRTPVADQ